MDSLDARTRPRHPRDILEFHLPALLLGLVMLWCYVPTFVWLWGRWFARDSYYSHGVLIPLVTVFLIWQKRDELQQVPVQSSKWGVPLVVAGLIVQVISSVLRIFFTSAFSLLIVLVGLILHFYGSRVIKVIKFPVFFLFFMMPLPLVVIVNISFQMKIFAAEIAERLLNQIGLVAVRYGSIIRMQRAYVVVDDVCSGLRSLISLAALGSIFAYWLKGPMVKRIFLFLTTVPIAIVTNVCRVVFLSTVSEVWGPEYAKGALHTVSGFLVFAMAFVMLYFVSRLIE